MGPCHKTGHADYVGCSCLRQRAFRREPECRHSLGAMRQRAEAGPGRSAWPRIYTETKIIKRQRRLSKCRVYLVGYEISQEYKRRRFDNEKIGAPTDFSATIGKQKIRKCTSSYTQKYMRAVLQSKNKTEYSIDDIIGEAIRDPAHSGAVANPQPPRYIISSEEGLKSMLVRIKRKRREISRSHRSKNEGRRSCFSSGGCFIPEG